MLGIDKVDIQVQMFGEEKEDKQHLTMQVVGAPGKR